MRQPRTDVTGSSTWEVRHPDRDIHLVCNRCEQVTHHHTTIVDALRRELARDLSFDADTIDIHVTGTCPTCVSV